MQRKPTLELLLNTQLKSDMSRADFEEIKRLVSNIPILETSKPEVREFYKILQAIKICNGSPQALIDLASLTSKPITPDELRQRDEAFNAGIEREAVSNFTLGKYFGDAINASSQKQEQQSKRFFGTKTSEVLASIFTYAPEIVDALEKNPDTQYSIHIARQFTGKIKPVSVGEKPALEVPYANLSEAGRNNLSKVAAPLKDLTKDNVKSLYDLVKSLDCNDDLFTKTKKPEVRKFIDVVSTIKAIGEKRIKFNSDDSSAILTEKSLISLYKNAVLECRDKQQGHFFKGSKVLTALEAALPELKKVAIAIDKSNAQNQKPGDELEKAFDRHSGRPR